ncbi:MAG: cysteine protease StiP domain-containing protein, partial [Akkermansia muciniphila]
MAAADCGSWKEANVFSTYKENDVILLLKDITGLVPRIGTAEREKLIQQGVHYSEMIPLEYEPSDSYLETFYRGLSLYAKLTSQAVSETARQIRAEKQGEIVLVSLARAGTPIGILLKRFMEKIYQAKTIHYSISIIRGKGIDRNAMDYILSMHKAESMQFVDGWTGKGAIQRELDAAMREYPGVSSGLAVLSDPAGVAEKAGTNDDFL